MRRRAGAAALVVAAAAAGGALALAATDDPAPVPSARAWYVSPEVPGAARKLVPFGFESGADGRPTRAWALARNGDFTVILTRAPDGGWTRASLVLPPGLDPVGGTAPEHAAEMTADGHGAMLAISRRDPTVEATLLTREPGGSFLPAPVPAPGAVLQPDEHLAAKAAMPGARALLAAAGGSDPATAGAFVAPTDDDGIGTAVLHYGSGAWTREPFETLLPTSLHPVALAVAAPDQAWLLARAGSPAGGGDDLRLLRRVVSPAPHWVEAPFQADKLLGGAPRPDGVETVTVAGPPADPLTATTDGLWIDLRLGVGGGKVVDATEHLTVGPPAAPDPSSSGPSSSGPSSTDPSSSNPTGTSSTAPSSANPAPPSDSPTLTVDGRWCDARTPAGDALCDHPLGFAFADGDRGYRSIAFPKTADNPFGSRYVSAPIDAGVAAGAPRRAAERQGGLAALAGERFVLTDGIGEDGTSTTQAIAFAPSGEGLTGGTLAFGAVSPTAPRALVPAPVGAPWDVLFSGAASPAGDGRVLALTRYGGMQVYVPGTGWVYANMSLSNQPRGRPFSFARAMAWPRTGTIIGVGSAGLLTTSHADPSGTVERYVPPSSYDGLPVSATFLDVDCTDSDPLECTAVGRDGLLVRGDGDTWTVEHLPGDGAGVDITSVRYAGRTALLATGTGLFTGENGDWKPDPKLTAPIHVLDALPDGGAVIDGRFARDDASSDWHATEAALDLNPIAIAAFRSGGHVRTLVSATADPVPLPAPAEATGDRRGPPTLDPSPAGAVVLREADGGWVDIDRAGYQPSGGRDLPETTPNTRAFVVGADGTGWMLGGRSGGMDSGFEAITPGPTSGWLNAGAPADFPDTAGRAVAAAETPTPEGSVRLAVGGHPTCLDRCTAGGGQDLTPDVHLRSAVAQVAALRADGAGPSALIVGGGRASVGGEPLDVAGAARFRALLDGSGVPTYALPGPGDVPDGGGEAFAAAFATAAAPQGSGPVPAGVDLSMAPQPGGGDQSKARAAYAFDVRTGAGTVRVATVDNAAGTLAGGTDGPQAHWISDMLTRSANQSIPVVVVGSQPLDDSQGATPAADAADELALLAGRASAYVATAGVDDPSSPLFGGTLSRSIAQPSGAAAPLPLLQSSTLGYGTTQASYAKEEGRVNRAAFSRTRTPALMLLDVGVAARDPETNIAPVSALAEPLLDGIALDDTRRIALGSATPLNAYGTDPAPQRFFWNTVDGRPQEASGTRFGSLTSLFGPCYLCDDNIPIDVEFSSSDPSVGYFVGIQQVANDRPSIKTDGTGAPLPDPRSGVFCPLTQGTTTISMRAAGRLVERTVVVGPPLDLPEEITGRDHVKMVPAPIPEGTCELGIRFVRAPDEPAPAPPVETKLPAHPAPKPSPAHHHAHHPVHHAPVPVPAPPPAAPVTPLQQPSAGQPMPDSARPIVSPASKAPAPAPPAPPHGVSAQQVPVTQAQVQVQPATRAAEQRREREAFEADNLSVAYEHPPVRFPWEGIAVAALLVAAGAGGATGRMRRQRAQALAYERRRP